LKSQYSKAFVAGSHKKPKTLLGIETKGWPAIVLTFLGPQKT
jgi:hypothetical protein